MILEKLLAGFVFAGCVLLAQSTPLSPAATSQVHMRLLAVDSSNQPVTDLTIGDLEITDQAKPVKILSLRKAETPVPLAPHEFYNKGAAARTTVIVFDLLNQDRINGMESSRKLGHGLGQLASGDSLYFYITGLDGALVPIHPLPAPGAPAGDPAWVKGADEQIQTALKTVDKARKSGMTLEDKVKKTYVNLENVAKNLNMLPGDKAIVWVTDGVPQAYKEKDTSWESVGSQEATGRATPDIHTSILGDSAGSFGAGGTKCGEWFGDCAVYVPHLSLTLATAHTPVYMVSYGVPDANTAKDNDFFANSTGGRTFVGRDLGDILGQIRSDEKSAYEVTYQPDPDYWDKKYHKIKASCSRQGVRILTENRLLAVPIAEQKTPPAKDENSALIAALTSPADASDIGLRVAISPVAGQKAVHFAIHIDVGDLQLKQQGANFADDITILFADYTSPGNLKTPPTPQDLQLTMTPEQHARVLKEGLGFEVDHALDPTIKQVRFVVYDHANNAYGSLSIPVADQAAPAAH